MMEIDDFIEFIRNACILEELMNDSRREYSIIQENEN